jgi:peptide-methionine (S)-S-oxide reductase
MAFISFDLARGALYSRTVMPLKITLCLVGLLFSMNTTSAETKTNAPAAAAKTDSIILGAGCFWCTEAIFQQIPGVLSVKPGYTGGKTKNPSYQDICTGDTGHAEVAQITFDSEKTSLEKIFDVFWEAHDPTTLNRQGADVGNQYRSAIFYSNDAQRQIAEKSKTVAAKKFSKPIVTEITKAGPFYLAENYHHDYYKRNKNKNPYCQVIIAPKLRKLGLQE